MCEVPFIEAPALFGRFDEPGGGCHCFVKCQPGTADELKQMLMAIRMAELDCIHYRGSNRPIQLELIQVGSGRTCDSLPPDLQLELADREAKERELQRKLGIWYTAIIVAICGLVFAIPVLLGFTAVYLFEGIFGIKPSRPFEMLIVIGSGVITVSIGLYCLHWIARRRHRAEKQELESLMRPRGRS
jgi:hypothetical protein